MKKYKEFLLRFIPSLLVLLFTVVLSQLFFRSMLQTETRKSWNALFMSRDHTAWEISSQFHSSMDWMELAADAIVTHADFDKDQTVLDYLAAIQETTIFDRIDVIYPDGTILVPTGERVADNSGLTYEERIAMGVHISLRTPDFYDGSETLYFYAPIQDTEGKASGYCWWRTTNSTGRLPDMCWKVCTLSWRKRKMGRSAWKNCWMPPPAGTI